MNKGALQLGRVHALHGFIGSGKSTLARRLEQALPALRFSPDEWTHALLGANPPEALYRPALAGLLQMFQGHWVQAALLGSDVVLDYGFWTRHERDELRSLCAHHGLELRLYRLHVPDEVLWERVASRNAGVAAGEDRASVWINSWDFQAFRQHFQPLDPEEAWVEPEGH
ncbi:AAA family ATPase [Deinococcus arcticus]|uniref:AAA family ATPase n=1 Tax=Deinococcus arcticus TaxID=2136176 RepID=UPI001304D8D3|nr:AAA family ATPase [Deinococcus arcticus]